MHSYVSKQKQCRACKDGVTLPFAFSMAFQPIIDVEADCVYAYEALVRGVKDEPAASVLARVTDETMYAFDQSCRVKAINLAVQLGLADTGAKLAINFMPGAIYSPAACIRLTLETARQADFPLDRLIFEITEAEKVKNATHLLAIAEEYRRHGFLIAIDDFGAGYAGLNLLADLMPDILKIDMDLIRKIHLRSPALAIVKALSELCSNLGVAVIAEGVETYEEFTALREMGVSLMQGYLFARPAFECLPSYVLPSSLNA